MRSAATTEANAKSNTVHICILKYTNDIGQFVVCNKTGVVAKDPLSSDLMSLEIVLERSKSARREGSGCGSTRTANMKSVVRVGVA